MVEGTLAEKDSVYRKPATTGWVELDHYTWAMRVPGGMVIRSTLGNGSSMCFVPCDAYDRRDWLAANEVS